MSWFKASHTCLKVPITRFPWALTQIPLHTHTHTHQNPKILILITLEEKVMWWQWLSDQSTFKACSDPWMSPTRIPSPRAPKSIKISILIHTRGQTSVTKRAVVSELYIRGVEWPWPNPLKTLGCISQVISFHPSLILHISINSYSSIPHWRANHIYDSSYLAFYVHNILYVPLE